MMKKCAWRAFVSEIHCVSAANKGRSTVSYCQSSVFDRPYLLFNDHCDQWLFPEIFFLLILFIFPRNLLKVLELVFLEFKHIYETQRTSLFFLSVQFLLVCFVIILCINTFHLFVFFHCKETHKMNQFSYSLLFCNHST